MVDAAASADEVENAITAAVFAMLERRMAAQANRQTGSAFKPIVYLCAMEHGMTPASIVLDATDRRILLELDDDPRLPVALLAQRLSLARGTVHARLERLAASGALRSHSARA